MKNDSEPSIRRCNQLLETARCDRSTLRLMWLRIAACGEVRRERSRAFHSSSVQLVMRLTASAAVSRTRRDMSSSVMMREIVTAPTMRDRTAMALS